MNRLGVLVFDFLLLTYQLGLRVVVGHVIRTLGVGDRPASPFHLDRIYTLLYHVEPLCSLPVQHHARNEICFLHPDSVVVQANLAV
jgi:hypothetical protein